MEIDKQSLCTLFILKSSSWHGNILNTLSGVSFKYIEHSEYRGVWMGNDRKHFEISQLSTLILFSCAFFVESNWYCDESHRGRQGEELWRGLPPVPAWRGVFPTCYQMWVTIRDLMVHFSVSIIKKLLHPSITSSRWGPWRQGKRENTGQVRAVPGPSWGDQGLPQEQRKTGKEACQRVTGQWQVCGLLLCIFLRKHCHTQQIKCVLWICVRLCVLRSDSDSEGENPEKKKLQEQLMGKEVKALRPSLVSTLF